VDADPVVRRDAAAAVGQLAPEFARDALAELVQCCGVNDSEVRKAALGVLAKMVGPEDKGLAPGIRGMLSDKDGEVRRNAAFVLASIGGDAAAPALPGLLDALNGGALGVRRQAAAAISNLGPAGADAIPALIKTLAAPDDELRAYAALALGGIGEKADRAIPDLVKMIANQKEKPDARVEAATALSRIGEVDLAKHAGPDLVGGLGDANDTAFVLQGKVKVLVRERVIWALRVHNAGLRDYPAVLDAFTKILSEPRQADIKMLYFDSAYMLGMLKGPQAPAKTIDVLGEFLKDDLIQIYVGKEAKSVGGTVESPADLKVKETGMGDGRIMAVQALGRIGSRVADRKDIIRELQAIERNKDLWGRLRAETKELLK